MPLVLTKKKQTPMGLLWSGSGDLNPGPLVPETSVLPTELLPVSRILSRVVFTFKNAISFNKGAAGY